MTPSSTDRPTGRPTGRARPAVLVAAATVLVAAAATVAVVATRPDAPADPAPAASAASARTTDVVDASGARTRLPDLATPTGEPVPAGLADAAPARGRVAQVAGPFDDRFAWSGLSFDGRRVSGTLTVTSDVSDLLELEAVAGFYDRAGRLVATRRFVHHATVHDEAGAHLPDESERVRIAVPPALRSTVVSAAVGVPVLVNE